MPNAGYNQPLIDIGSMVGTLWKNKSIILVSTLLFMGGALAYVLFAPRTYTAKAVILVDPRESKTTKSINVLDGIGSDSAAIASQVAVIKSTGLLKRVFEEQKTTQLVKLENKKQTFSRLIFFTKILTPAEEELKERLAFEKFRKNIAIYREGLTYVLNISYKSKDPDQSANVANAIVRNYISGQVSERSGANQEVTTLLNNRIHFLRETVNSTEKAVADFKNNNNIIDIGSGQTILNARLEQLNNQWLSAQATARDKINRYNQAKLLENSPLNSHGMAGILTSRTARQLRLSYNARVSTLIKTKVSLRKSHPSRVAVQAEVDHFGGLIKKERKRILSSLKASKDLAQSNAKAAEKELNQLRKELERSNQFSIRLRQLQRTADASRTVLEQFLSRAKETSNLGKLQRSNIRILSRAAPPLKPSWPKPTLTLLVAGLLGLLGGIILALSPLAEPSHRTANILTKRYL